MNKSDRQNIGIYKYLNNNAIGTLHYIMRFGKTLTALKIIERLLKKYPKSTIIIVVPSVIVKETWDNAIQELDSIEYFKLFSYIENSQLVFTANELFNYSDMVVDLLIVDELHKFIAPERIKLIDNTKIKYTYNLGLTGTYPFGNKTIEELYPIVDTITEEEAIKEGWISKYKEYNISLELDDDSKESYYTYNNEMHEMADIFKGLYTLFDYNNVHFFKGDLDLIISCYRGKSTKTVYVKSHIIREMLAQKMGWNSNLDVTTKTGARLEKYWNPDNIKKHATRYYNAMYFRNKLLKFNITKLEAVKDIYHKFKDYNIICFNESIQFAEVIADTINNLYQEDKAICYHSKVKGKTLINFITGEYFKTRDGRLKGFGKQSVLKYIIEMFKIEKYKFISTVNSMDEGLNIPNLNMVLSTAGTINFMQYEQRSARGKTVNIGKPDEVTLVINLFFNDFKYKVNNDYVFVKSRDLTKLKLRQRNKVVPMYTLENFIKNVKINEQNT